MYTYTHIYLVQWQEKVPGAKEAQPGFGNCFSGDGLVSLRVAHTKATIPVKTIEYHTDPGARYSRPNTGQSSRHAVSFGKPGKINSCPYATEGRGRACSSYSSYPNCLAMATTT